MSSPRIKIRCPNCQNYGSARAELLNRRVSCKHCSHTFRAIPVTEVDPVSGSGIVIPDATMVASTDSAPAADQRPSRLHIEALELEIRRLREDLSVEHAAAGEAASLRAKLSEAVEAARAAEDRETALRKEMESLRDQLDQTAATTGHEPKNSLREEELRFLRDQLDRARAEHEVEVRRRREATTSLSTRTADHEKTLAARQADQEKALVAKQAELAQALDSQQAEHARALGDLVAQLERAKADAQGLEASRLAAESARTEAENRLSEQTRSLHDELAGVRLELDEAKKSLDGLRIDRGRADEDRARAVEELQGQLAQLEGQLKEAEAARADRDRLGQELESHRSRLSEVEQRADDQKKGAESLRIERDRIDAERAELRDQLEQGRSSLADAEVLRKERDEARVQRDRIADELDSLKATVEEAEKLAADWNFPSTQMEVPSAVALAMAEARADDPGLKPSTLADDLAESLQRETESLRAELAERTARLDRQDAEVARLTLERDHAEAVAREAGQLEARRVADAGKAEVESLRVELEAARTAAESAWHLNQALTERVGVLEASPAPVGAQPAKVALATSVDPAMIEAEHDKAVDEAVKGAWADFERRLAETQGKLKAANQRADLLEAEAREAREQIAAREKGLEPGEGSSFDAGASMTSLRILDARGTARLTPADAEARLALARQLAIQRKDKSLIDRIAKMAGKVHADLKDRNYTLAETLVRGAEIETGLDPGGFSINGQRIFRPSPTILGSLTALAPAFERVMREEDLASMRSTLEEMKTILGDQAGLPEIRWVGRTPATKRPIAEAEAFDLFVSALENEGWLMRPIALKKPLPDTSLTTYVALIEGCCEARKSAQSHAPDRIPLLHSIIQASCQMLTRRQQPDGHFSFLDPRGRASKIATVVDGMVAKRPDSVKDGWVVDVDPIGIAQAETGACAMALSTAGRALGRPDWSQAALRAADWAMNQPGLANFVATAASVSLLARAYLDGRQDRHFVRLAKKLAHGLLPGQVENGRWIDPNSATTQNHLLIIRGMHDAWEAIPADREELRRNLKESLDLAMATLLAESKAIGVPPQGNALRELIRHRDLFADNPDPRLEPAILDSATVIQELCHDGPKPKLGVAADQLAALMRL